MPDEWIDESAGHGSARLTPDDRDEMGRLAARGASAEEIKAFFQGVIDRAEMERRKEREN